MIFKIPSSETTLWSYDCIKVVLMLWWSYYKTEEMLIQGSSIHYWINLHGIKKQVNLSLFSIILMTFPQVFPISPIIDGVFHGYGSSAE